MVLRLVSALDLQGRTPWIVDAHATHIARADETGCISGSGKGDTRVRDQFDLTRNNLPDSAARGVSKRLSGKCSHYLVF